MRSPQGAFNSCELSDDQNDQAGPGDALALTVEVHLQGLRSPMADDRSPGKLPTPHGAELADTELDPLSSQPIPVDELKTWPAGTERAEERDEVIGDFEPADKPGVIGRLGQYEILEQIGQGSMGLVFKARDTVLRRLVAIKLLSAPQTRNPQPRARFLREARTAAAVHHENVVTIFAVEEVRGRPYLVMHYVDGVSLQELIERQGALPPAEVVRFGRQVALGLAAAHAEGLIHRDIKPSNILLERKTGQARITDFGLARAVDDVGLTHPGVVSGTPSYMAPEQARGEPVDHRADLFSLGGVLHAMCTGRPPFRAEGTMAILRRVCDEPSESIRSSHPEVPEELAAIIDRLHAKDPAVRYQSAAEVAEALDRVSLHEEAGPARCPVDDRQALRSPPHKDADPLFAPPRRRLPRALAAIVLAGLAILFTEVSGVSHISSVVATVLRIRTPEGILVLELDDPNLKVAVDGDGEEIVITGGGDHEVRLRPGTHKLRATRDGVPVFDELLTISRGDRRVLRLSREQLGALSTASPLREAQAILSGHADLVHAAVFSPDGRRIASAGYDKSIRVWDTEKKSLLATLKGHEKPVARVVFSPDGKTLASASFDHSVRLWDAENGEAIALLGKHEDWAWAVAFAPDGKTLASAGADFTIRLWDIGRRVLVETFDAPGGIRDIAFSPDGREIAAALGWAPARNLQIWNITAKSHRLLAGHPTGTNAVAYLPDGRLISVGNDRMIRIWDQAGRQQSVLSGHARPVTSLAVLPSGKTLITCDGDFRVTDAPGSVKLWDLERVRESFSFDGQAAPLFALAVSPDGKLLLSGGADTLMRLWDLKQLSADAAGTAAGPK